MADLKGTETEKNILAAFAGESQARNKYGFFAKKARKEGFVQIAEVFEETANQERAHASTLFKMLDGAIGSTEENLRAAAAGEQYELDEMYPSFAKIARAEGFDLIANIFEAIAIAERKHGERFTKLADNIAEQKVFTRKKKQTWTCRNCGYQHEGKSAPGVCPACAHGKAHFEIEAENF
ncbi:MAG: rubrerythrin family protein [Magnetococcales bacterium]|nr:rubrerythrin family protein [Magnetococcales bacterium]